MHNLKQVSEIIEKWKLNKTLLAEKLGMPKGTLSHCLAGKQYYTFSEVQLEKLKVILIELRNDLDQIDQVDFNEALRIIAQKEV